MKRYMVPLLVFLACCSVNANGSLSEQDELAVFLLEQWIGPKADPAWVNCISVDNKDPSKTIIDAIKDDGITTFDVASSCKAVVGESGSYHIATKKKAMFVNIQILKSMGGGKYLVSTSTYHHGLFGGSQEFEIQKQNGKWVRTKLRRMIVS